MPCRSAILFMSSSYQAQRHTQTRLIRPGDESTWFTTSHSAAALPAPDPVTALAAAWSLPNPLSAPALIHRFGVWWGLAWGTVKSRRLGDAACVKTLKMTTSRRCVLRYVAFRNLIDV